MPKEANRTMPRKTRCFLARINLSIYRPGCLFSPEIRTPILENATKYGWGIDVTHPKTVPEFFGRNGRCWMQEGLPTGQGQRRFEDDYLVPERRSSDYHEWGESLAAPPDHRAGERGAKMCDREQVSRATDCRVADRRSCRPRRGVPRHLLFVLRLRATCGRRPRLTEPACAKIARKRIRPAFLSAVADCVIMIRVGRPITPKTE